MRTRRAIHSLPDQERRELLKLYLHRKVLLTVNRTRRTTVDRALREQYEGTVTLVGTIVGGSYTTALGLHLAPTNDWLVFPSSVIESIGLLRPEDAQL